MKASPERSLGLRSVAPFFVLAPLGAVGAGILAAGAGPEVFVAINTGRLVAVTHALVLGWVGGTVMGATYQLGSAVLNGRLLSLHVLRLQMALHLVAMPLFIWSLVRWNIPWMGLGGTLLAASLLLFLCNAATLIRTANGRGYTRTYMGVALVFLVLAGALGVTWVGGLQYHWFAITFGGLSAHAHLGLVGWLGLTLMGVSYQLVPMFNVAPRTVPRFGTCALLLTIVATIAFAGVMFFDPPPAVRLALAAGLAAGPLLWSTDMVAVLRQRNRRRLDVQGWATLASLGFLWLAILLGIGAAAGTPFTPDDQPARWPLAYGAAAILGWAGTAVFGNAIKIHAFLVWLHRHRHRVGTAPVPLIGDLYSDAFARAGLATHVAATLLFVCAALSGSLPLFRIAGLVLVASGTGCFATLLSMYGRPATSTRRAAFSHGATG